MRPRPRGLALKALTPRVLAVKALTPRVLALKALTPRLARMLAAPNPFPPALPVNLRASR